MKSIVIISTGQPSTNPRMVKEADALQNAGYDVIVLFCFFVRWASEKDAILLKKVQWKYCLVGGSPDFRKVFFDHTRFRFKVFKLLHLIIGNRLLLAEKSMCRSFNELLCESKKHKADLYIGHNLGSLPIAVKAAKYHHAKCGFDFEDYHRGELIEGQKTLLKRVIFIEDKYVSSLDYYSTSSDLISQITQKNFPKFSGKKITLYNSFPLNQQPRFKEKSSKDQTLQLFWFSQTIGTNRGLEIVLDALKLLADENVHLTLAGRCDDIIKEYISIHPLRSNIHLAGIIQPENLPAFASQFDVGLGIELRVPENRNICLTNKIFTYLLAGNAVILSKTAMQSDFNKAYRIGNMFEPDSEKDLAIKIKEYKDLEKLNTQKRHNYQLANTHFNWEKESEKLLAVID